MDLIFVLQKPHAASKFLGLKFSLFLPYYIISYYMDINKLLL